MIREGRDPVEKAKRMLIEFGWSTEDELKDKEKEIRKQLDDEYEKIKNDPFPTEEDLYTNIGTTPQHFIRTVEYKDSKHIDPKHLQ
jgi:TPP-dependent pyruvate/acetoin dehydrogenase alpha subunit